MELLLREARSRYLESQPIASGTPHSEYMHRAGFYTGMMTMLEVVDPEYANQIGATFQSEGFV